MLRSVAGKTLFEQRRALVWWALGTIAMVFVVVAYYPSVRNDPSLTDFLQNLPPAAQAFSGGVNVDFSSPDGWLTSQLFSNIGPLIFIIYGVVLGAGAIGREEDRGTAELLLTTPISRRRVVLEKALAALVLIVALGAVLLVSLLVGTKAFDMEIGFSGVLAASIQTVLLGTTFCALALAISAWLGPRAHAAAISGSVAFAGFMLYSLAPVVDSLHGWQKLSAFYWYQQSNPIGTGFDSGHLAVLAGVSLALSALAVALFDRRDVYVA
jgi:beta-exotoxin I transport system permease protein